MVAVLVNGTEGHDPRIVAVLCAERQLEIARDFVAAEVERYVRQVVEQIAFAIAMPAPVPVGIVSGRFAAQEGVVDLAGSSVAENEDAIMVVVVVA